jgi:hypothetical protein
MIKRTFRNSHAWAVGPPENYEKFLMDILLTLNLELFKAEVLPPQQA